MEVKVCSCGVEVTFAPGKSISRCACKAYHRRIVCDFCGDTGTEYGHGGFRHYVKEHAADGQPYLYVARCDCKRQPDSTKNTKWTYYNDILHGCQWEKEWIRYNEKLPEPEKRYHSEWLVLVKFPALYDTWRGPVPPVKGGGTTGTTVFPKVFQQLTGSAADAKVAAKYDPNKDDGIPF